MDPREDSLNQASRKPYPNCLVENAQRMAADLAHPKSSQSLAEYCGTFDTRFGLPSGTGMRVARLLMQERVLAADLESPDLARAPLAAFRVASGAGQLHIRFGT